jgi:hypothetical protein
MMLEAHQIFSFLEVDRLDEFLTNMGHSIQVKHAIQALGLGPGQVERVLKFLNWYVQGGQATIQGYEGLARWKEEMDGEMGAFLRQYLRLGVVVNNRLFRTHRARLSRILASHRGDCGSLPESGYRRAKEAFLVES